MPAVLAKPAIVTSQGNLGGACPRGRDSFQRVEIVQFVTSLEGSPLFPRHPFPPFSPFHTEDKVCQPPPIEIKEFVCVLLS